MRSHYARKEPAQHTVVLRVAFGPGESPPEPALGAFKTGFAGAKNRPQSPQSPAKARLKAG